MTVKHWKYPAEVPYELEIEKIGLFQDFERTAKRFPNKTACSFKGKKKTYKELYQDAAKLGNTLKSLGIKKGDRVAIMMPNTPQVIASIYGILSIGGIFVSISPLYTSDEIHTLLENSGSRILITFDMFLKNIREASKATSLEKIIAGSVADELPKKLAILYRIAIGRKHPKVNSKSSIKEFDYNSITKTQLSNIESTPVDPKKDLACLQYTGGTTGTPKGAMLTHENLYSQVISIAPWIKWDMSISFELGEETVMAALPFSHIFGLTTTLLWGAHIGAHIVLIPDPREFEELLSLLDKNKATFFFAVPTLFLALANHKNIKKYSLSSLKACISGGAALPEAVSEKFESVADTIVVEGFGLSEASPITHVNPLNPKIRRSGTMGLPFINTDARVQNLETGEIFTDFDEKGQTKEGMLYVYGPQIMKGYWKNPEETSDVLTDDGWLKTGDIAIMDKDGFFIYKDRVKDMINVSGYKVWPAETEEILYKHEAVHMVAVIPTRDPQSGEAVKAVIVLNEGYSEPELKELREFCRGKLAPYKIPQRIEYRSELPLSPVGKVLRKVLKDEEMDKYVTS